MALDPSNSSSMEQLASKGLTNFRKDRINFRIFSPNPLTNPAVVSGQWSVVGAVHGGVNEPVDEGEGEECARKQHTRQFVDGGRMFDGSRCVKCRYDGHQLKRQPSVTRTLLLLLLLGVCSGG